MFALQLIQKQFRRFITGNDAALHVLALTVRGALKRKILALLVVRAARHVAFRKMSRWSGASLHTEEHANPELCADLEHEQPRSAFVISQIEELDLSGEGFQLDLSILTAQITWEIFDRMQHRRGSINHWHCAVNYSADLSTFSPPWRIVVEFSPRKSASSARSPRKWIFSVPL
jgi:hypothetical protein